MNQTQASIMSLPSEIITALFKFLEIKDVINFGKVNKYCRMIYLEIIKSTKYISNKIKPYTNIKLFIDAILENVRLGNRRLIIYLDDNRLTHQRMRFNTIFKIVNITTMPDVSKNITLHLIAEDNSHIEIITLNSFYNSVTAKIAYEYSTVNIIIKMLTDSAFRYKMRPFNVRLSEESFSLLWNK